MKVHTGGNSQEGPQSGQPTAAHHHQHKTISKRKNPQHGQDINGVINGAQIHRQSVLVAVPKDEPQLTRLHSNNALSSHSTEDHIELTVAAVAAGTVGGNPHHEETHVGVKYVIVNNKDGEELKGVEEGSNLLENNGQALAYPSAPYVGSTEFNAMDAYPLTQHLHNPAGANYVYTDPSYQNYYTQYQPAQVHSPQSYPLHPSQHSATSPALSGSIDDSDGQLGHAARASPQTLKWLYENYEVADGTSLPRCTLYDHYKKHCSDIGLDPVNAASFGKLIRSVFSGLKTRRLGTRGNSKYHYYGIRIKPQSSLNHFPEEYGGSITKKKILQSNANLRRSERFNNATNATYAQETAVVYSTYDRTSSSTPQRENSVEEHPYILGEGHVPRLFPDFSTISPALESVKMDPSHVMKLIEGYRQNCQDILSNIRELRLDLLEDTWTSFWLNEQMRVERYPVMKALATTQLYSLCMIPQIQQWMLQTDYYFYQVLIDVLMPNVLSPSIKSDMITQIRNVAKSLESQMAKALSNAPQELLQKKVEAVKVLSQTLRRYTSLNHVATAARGVLQKADQIKQMHSDFNRVEMTCVQEQAGWVCACDPATVQHFQNSFRENLEKQTTLEGWAQWMEAVLDNVLARYHDKAVTELAEVAKQFLLNWSFYNNLIIRDLTLRSAQSFGSFHLIRLLFDDYMLYLVEQRLAKASGRPAITIMAPGFRPDVILFEETTQEHLLSHKDEWEIVGQVDIESGGELLYTDGFPVVTDAQRGLIDTNTLTK
ncbi:unnamed protein product, partial [Mesorhabditis belari]|uniref:RFX-type winged-helix domain-containing protein n=1 Tax=Mesorhabditis belari TaxID=2138241 RepID=A0AAF3F294_9BILA